MIQIHDMAALRFQYTNLGFEPEMMKLVDDYRFQQRIPTRSAAIRQLIEIGLVSQGVIPLENEDIAPKPPFTRAIPVITGGKLAGWAGDV
jgi:hypothetical protein